MSRYGYTALRCKGIIDHAMSPLKERITVAALLGPTAVGKSVMAVEIAPLIDAEIVSLDSMQVYRDMDIGTAKPRENLLRSVPHHLLNIVDPDSNYSVAEYQADARLIVEDILERGKLPLLVGGSGLYFESVVFDIKFPPGSMQDPLRRELEDWAERDPDGLRAELERVDPAFASTEDHFNMRRVIRAMEVYLRTGRAISKYRVRRGEHRKYYSYAGVAINIPRVYLYRAIDNRVDRMIEDGLVDEVRSIVEKGEISTTARQALGYKEVLDHLDRDVPLEETICKIKKRTRRYAKRQLTWFRRIPDLVWFDLGERDLHENRQNILVEIVSCLKERIDKERLRAL